MRKYLIATAACALGASTLLSACGDKEIAKAEFITKANAVCLSYEAKSQELETSFTNTDSFDDFKKYIESNASLADDQIKDLKALGYPKGDKGALDAIYNDIKSGTSTLKSEVSKMSSMDEANTAGSDENGVVAKAAEKIETAAKKLGEYGPSECAGTSEAEMEDISGN